MRTYETRQRVEETKRWRWERREREIEREREREREKRKTSLIKKKSLFYLFSLR